MGAVAAQAPAPSPDDVGTVQAAVRRRILHAFQRRGWLERLLRYCARPPFSGERLEWIDAERVRYRLPKPRVAPTAPACRA